MSADANPLDYHTPAAALPPQAPAAGSVVSMFTGPDRVGCGTMLVLTVVASGLAVGIVTALACVLA